MRGVREGDLLSQNIIRVKKETNYVVMDKTFLNDKSLSWKAKGLMAFMLSKPDDWQFYLEELIKHSTDGKASLRSGFKELQEKNYVIKKRYQNEQGLFEWETIVYEQPYTEKPSMDNPSMEKPSMENRTLLNNDSLSNDSLNNNKDIVEIINYLNDVANKNYRHTTKKTQSLIKARMNEGFTVDDFKKVIDIKNHEWKDNPKFQKFIRPETLFGNKFEGYLNQDENTRNSVFNYNPEIDSF